MWKITIIAFGTILFCLSVFAKIAYGSKRRYTGKTTGTVTDYHVTEDQPYPVVTIKSPLGTNRLQQSYCSVRDRPLVGSEITVRYDPANPSAIYCPSLEGRINIFAWFGMLSGIAIIIAGVFYVA